ncbi:zinc-dependent metalloprotease [Hyunsoonleella rubra]|uniref:Reprolysin-like metallopeptidase n=1 Tax=Hyunsoonleella rubra TaxID=1737062 RepID=A0ABW5TAA2_9FLAO
MVTKTNLHYVFSTAMFLLVFSVYGQQSPWTKVKSIQNYQALSKLNLESTEVDYFSLNQTEFLQKLASASTNKNGTTTISIPTENGKIQAFEIEERSVFSPELAVQFPDIKSYVGYAIDGSGGRLRMSVSPNGIQTMISYAGKPMVFMQPLERGSEQYLVYQKGDKKGELAGFKCNTIETLKTKASKSGDAKIDEGGANDQTLQTFRIAISTTGEYTAYHGGTVGGALAGINATLTRVNGIFEADMAVTFQLVNATQLIYTNSTTDPYSNPSVGTDESNSDNLNGWSLQLQNTLSSTIGNAAYDIGHLFGDDGGGGSAGCIGCVCRDDNTSDDMDLNKGSAYTSPPNGVPEGDTFDLNYVIHEIGHQMGANHTWAFDTESGTNVNSEPGSGSTLMAYAGITGPDDVASDSDPYFHYHSIKQILDNLTTKSCQTTSALTNNPPSANAGSNFVIPAGTPYVLKGSATDADSGDVLTYCWEQTDSGKTDYQNFGPTLTSSSMNRSLPPSTSPDRYIPRLSSVLEGNITQTNPGLGSDWETVATVDRTLNWALTVRDRNPASTTVGQSSYDRMQIQVVDGTVPNPVGPFVVTSQNTNGIQWTQNTSETITWDVAGTDANGINTSNINILLSTDGGETFSTVLASNTPNDGSETITVPNIAAPFCRIMIEPVGNIYYAVNTEDFAIGYIVTTTCNQQYASNSNLNLPITDGNTVTNIINVPDSGTISSIKTNVDVTHTYISDLIVTLEHPNGSTSSVIWNENCFNSPGYQDFDIIFDNEGSAVACASPTNGTYIPANTLSIFDGLDSQGNWQISVSDGFAGDTGTLNDWYVEFCITTVVLGNDDFNGFTGLKVFPNPSEGNFNVQLQANLASNTVNIEVYDLRGRSIYGKTFKSTSKFEQTIDLGRVQSGLYILKVSDGQRTSSRKIAIE